MSDVFGYGLLVDLIAEVSKKKQAHGSGVRQVRSQFLRSWKILHRLARAGASPV